MFSSNISYIQMLPTLNVSTWCVFVCVVVADFLIGGGVEFVVIAIQNHKQFCLPCIRLYNGSFAPMNMFSECSETGLERLLVKQFSESLYNLTILKILYALYRGLKYAAIEHGWWRLKIILKHHLNFKWPISTIYFSDQNIPACLSFMQ